MKISRETREEAHAAVAALLNLSTTELKDHFDWGLVMRAVLKSGTRASIDQDDYITVHVYKNSFNNDNFERSLLGNAADYEVAGALLDCLGYYLLWKQSNSSR